MGCSQSKNTAAMPEAAVPVKEVSFSSSKASSSSTVMERPSSGEYDGQTSPSAEHSEGALDSVNQHETDASPSPDEHQGQEVTLQDTKDLATEDEDDKAMTVEATEDDDAIENNVKSAAASPTKSDDEDPPPMERYWNGRVKVSWNEQARDIPVSWQ